MLITSKELRKKYIEFFKNKNHKEIPSASLVPENDPTVLFTTAGMHPLVPYLLGEKHPEGKRLVNVQKCVRTGDIEDVGDSTHNTFFEMLGNWSLGDYFKNESIRWSWEFLTDKKWLGIDPKRIKVTVFEGDKDAPRDDESIKIWRECFAKFNINAEVYDKEKKNNETARIFPLPKEDNWWGPAGQTGPCGPDTEIFIDLGKPVNFEKCPNGGDCKPGCHCGRYVEIWNNVFMEYKGIHMAVIKNIKTENIIEIPKADIVGALEEEGDECEYKEEKYTYLRHNVKILENLPKKNVDTGMGMERTLAILNEFSNVYKTDVLAPIIEKVEKLSGKKCNDSEDIKKSIRIIADHIRTSVFMISDGVLPSNLDRGYVLRRILRRSVENSKELNLPSKFFLSLAENIISIYKEFYPELEKNRDKILNEIEKEENKTEQMVEKSKKERRDIYKKLHDIYLWKVEESAGKTTDKAKLVDFEAVAKEMGRKLFFIRQSYGLGLEASLKEIKSYFDTELTFEDEIRKSFQEELQKHQSLSRTASAGKFKGGLADASEETTRLHTAAHLLLESLRRVLGSHIHQKGSNITAERLRFDFSHPNKLTDEEKKKVEDLINEQIQKKLPVIMREMSLDEAKKIGAMGVFESKYGQMVKVYTIGDEKTGVFSKEICGGPHIKNTSELGKFKIKKEESSSAGVRRIKAVLE